MKIIVRQSEARFYDGECQQWHFSTRRLIGQTSEILSHNMYAYAMNNPVMMVDPNGEFAILAFIGMMAIGGLISATVDVGFQLWENGGDFSKIDKREVLGAFVGGAIAAMPIPGLNFAGAMALGAVGNLASGLVGGSVNSWSSATAALSLGAAGGGLGFGVGKIFTKALPSVTSKMLGMFPASTQSYPWTLFQYNSAVNSIAKDTINSLTRSTMIGAFSSQSLTEFGEKIIDKAKEMIKNIRE